MIGRNWSQSRIAGSLILLGTGLVASLGLAYLVSGRPGWLHLETAIYAVAIIQWMNLGTTLAAHGVPNLVFAQVSLDPRVHFRVGRQIRLRIVPITTTIALVIGVFFGAWAGLAAFLAIVMDATSAIWVADRNGRGRHLHAGIATLLNYPVFFFLVAIGAFIGHDGKGLILVSYVVASLSRFAWLAASHPSISANQDLAGAESFQMGLQSGLNYLLFRLDQLALGIFGALLVNMPDAFAPNYFFLAKYPELLGSAFVSLGTVFFPVYFLDVPFSWSRFQARVPRNAALGIAIVSFGTIVGLPLFLFAGGNSVGWFFALPFAVQSILILPVNVATYSWLRVRAFRPLLYSLGASTGIGMIMLAAIVGSGQFGSLAWVVPLQMALFIASFFLHALVQGKR